MMGIRCKPKIKKLGALKKLRTQEFNELNSWV